MANVKDDEYETFDLDAAVETAVGVLVYEIAEMIADTFGRSVIDADLELATAIIQRLTKS